MSLPRKGEEEEEVLALDMQLGGHAFVCAQYTIERVLDESIDQIYDHQIDAHVPAYSIESCLLRSESVVKLLNQVSDPKTDDPYLAPIEEEQAPPPIDSWAKGMIRLK